MWNQNLNHIVPFLRPSSDSIRAGREDHVLPRPDEPLGGRDDVGRGVPPEVADELADPRGGEELVGEGLAGEHGELRDDGRGVSRLDRLAEVVRRLVEVRFDPRVGRLLAKRAALAPPARDVGVVYFAAAYVSSRGNLSGPRPAGRSPSARAFLSGASRFRARRGAPRGRTDPGVVSRRGARVPPSPSKERERTPEPRRGTRAAASRFFCFCDSTGGPGAGAGASSSTSAGASSSAAETGASLASFAAGSTGVAAGTRPRFAGAFFFAAFAFFAAGFVFSSAATGASGFETPRFGPFFGVAVWSSSAGARFSSSTAAGYDDVASSAGASASSSPCSK